MNRQSWSKLLVAVSLWAGLAPVVQPKELVPATEANVMIELPFTAARTYSDPFNEVTLDVIFHDPNGHDLRVPAFWAGTNSWKVRYASPLVGTHRFRSQCSEARDGGLHEVPGSVEVNPYGAQNPLYARGPIGVPANRRFLEHEDG